MLISFMDDTGSLNNLLIDIVTNMFDVVAAEAPVDCDLCY
jgi:hypothetical protein